jgi:hypothetical protein
MATRRDTVQARSGPSPDENHKSGVMLAFRHPPGPDDRVGELRAVPPSLIGQARPKWSSHCTFVRNMLLCVPRMHVAGTEATPEGVEDWKKRYEDRHGGHFWVRGKGTHG